MHIDRNPYTRMRIEQLLVCCIIVVCCHCCADYNKHYLIRSVTTKWRRGWLPFQRFNRLIRRRKTGVHGVGVSTSG